MGMCEKIDISVDVRVDCAVCGKEMRIRHIGSDGYVNIQVTVEPCEKCAEKEVSQ